MRRYFRDLRSSKRWTSIFIAAVLAFGLLFIGNVFIAAASEPLEIGYFDFFYPRGTGKNDAPTGEKPESKIWFHDGSWWGSLWSEAGNSYHIYRLDWDTQVWTDTGVPLDDRPDSRADVLSDGDTLYVVSHLYANFGETVSTGSRGELYRYTYSGGTYSLDPDFPVEVSDARGEALVIAKDSTDMLWITYASEGRIKVAHSNANGGGDTDWSAPFQLPVSFSSVHEDDIASVISYNGHIGVMWSYQVGGAYSIQFATHVDGAPPDEWTQTAAYSVSGDDHVNLRGVQTSDEGRLFAVIKTDITLSTSIILLECDTIETDCTQNSNWTPHTVYYSKGGSPTRPVMALDMTNRDIYVFTRLKGNNGQDIYYKKSDLDNISFLEDSLGTPVISSAIYRSMNNVSTSKQVATDETGLLLLASDDNRRAYLHGCIDLSNTGSLNCLSPNSVVGTRFSSDIYQVNEAGGMTLTVTVENPVVSALPITIDYATVNGTAVAGQDYITATGTLTFPTGVTTQTFEIGIIDDGLSEDPETITLTLTNGPTVFPDTAVVTIFDDDRIPEARFADVNFDGLEDLGIGEVTVELNVPYYTPVSVDYATSDGTATSPGDYTATSGTVTFAPGETEAIFTVPLVDDGELEPTELINLTLSNPMTATLGTPMTATLSIIDDDIPPEVSLSSDSYSIAENGGSGTVTVQLSKTADGIVTVDYGTSDVTAVAPNDYTAIPTTTLTFNPGETIKTIDFFVHDDALQEFSEAALFKLGNPVGATMVDPSQAVIAILDDDTPPVVRFGSNTYNILEDGGWIEIDVELSFPFNATMTVDYEMYDVDTMAGFDYTPLNGTLIFNPFETEQSILIPITEDHNFELAETFKVRLLNPSVTTLSTPFETAVTIYDNDTQPEVSFVESAYSYNETVGLATVELELDATSYQTITVRIASTDGTAVSPADYLEIEETVTFFPGDTLESVTIPIVDETILEPNEDFYLAIDEPENVTLGAITDSKVTILDNDAPPTVDFVQADFEVTENVGTAEINLVLSSPAIAPVTVAFQSSDITALSGEDYTAVNDTVVFNPGETEVAIPLPIIDDNFEENNESLQLTLLSVDGGDLGTLTTATVLILDNEVPPVAQFAETTYTTGEGDGTFTVNVVLTNPSEETVTVDYSAATGTAVMGVDASLNSGRLTFAPGVVSQPVTMSILEDGIRELPESFVISLSNWVNSLPGSRASTEVTITDNDPLPVISFSGFTYAALESGDPAELFVSLSHPSSQAVTVDYTFTDGTAVNGVDYAASNGTLTFEPGELQKSFTVASLDDSLDEDNETVFLGLENPFEGVLGTPSTASLSIVDDDVTPIVAFALSSYTVSEDGVTAVLEVDLSAESGKTVIVPYVLNNSTATLGQDFVLGDEDHLTFIPGETNEKFTIQIIDDQISESTETIVITLVEPDNVILGEPSSAVVRIEDNDIGGVQFDSLEIDVVEGGEATISVSITKPQATPFSVNVTTNSGSAVSGDDFLGVATTLNFAANEINKQITVPIIDDALDEDLEKFFLTLDTPNGVQLGANTFMEVEIEDNDEAPTLTLSHSSYREFEGNGMLEVAVLLDMPSGKTITANYVTTDGTALDGSDYTATSGTVVLAAGEIRQTIHVPLLADDIDENEETFLITLDQFNNATPGQYMVATLRLRDGKGALLYLPAILR